MPELCDGWKETCSANRKTLLQCLAATFFWGLLAHAYIFLHSTFNYDSLNEFNSIICGNELKLKAGRVFVPIYRAIFRSSMTMPWLIGLLSLLFIGFAVFFAVKFFRLRSKGMILYVAGVFTVNVTVMATASTFIHDLDSDMLALLFSVLAAYLWKQHPKGWLYGILPVALSLGLYQSYISVTITLIIFDLLLLLIDDGTFQDTFARGLRSLGMLIGGGLVYLVSMKLICAVTGVGLGSGNYNSLDAAAFLTAFEWVVSFIRGYLKVFYKFLTAQSLYPPLVAVTVHLLIGISICALGLGWLIGKKKHGKEKLLFVALAAVLPLGMNISYVLAGAMSHDLMHYAFWLLYLLPLLLVQHLWKHCNPGKHPILRRLRVLPYALVALILWGNVQTANGLYLQKEMISKANQSLFSQILLDMEHTEGYVPGQTPVIFMGVPGLEEIPGFENLDFFGSFPHSLGTSSGPFYQTYFDYVMLNPAVMADPETWWGMRSNQEARAMPNYPSEGSIRMIDGNLVVKLASNPDEAPEEAEEAEYNVFSIFLPA